MNINDALRIHLAALDAGRSDFADTLALIERHFDYQPTGFHNGPLFNGPGENAGSCRVFALGQYGNLSEADTLRLFAQHYQEVMDEPAGSSHGNIRQFISTGWSGIRFEGQPLRLRAAPLTEDASEGSR
ncbi:MULTISPECIES: HopJ type III effector protein [Marinobacter]|uniref:Type III effector HopPmaJ n=1 Tax=Marinobacter profundi TaxID=2666256 RepID=A0A2G1UKG1_9GAMM|nr:MULTISPECIES: HopJ type III effector protein [Marinobacter]MBD3658187.1 HopJ type III effector protein [Marinobacter sp.]PHQ14925.1 type III effector HopPmaJ [Marinobacter profundi]